MIVIVDYGVGNLSSIQNMLKKAGAKSSISSQPEEILAADKLILPGVGAFDSCVSRLEDSGLTDIISRKVLKEKIPLLGICVGMQLLLEGSEEGRLAGLGWVRGKNIKFKQALLPASYKIPHMGWTEVNTIKPSKLLEGMYEEPRFYFVHSYHADLNDKGDELLTANYGYSFTAALEHENIIGVQFHPEKSHKFGTRLLENFINNY